MHWLEQRERINLADPNIDGLENKMDGLTGFEQKFLILAREDSENKTCNEKYNVPLANHIFTTVVTSRCFQQVFY